MGRREYADMVLKIVPRVLSSMDRDPGSETYGCLDKAYWFYKTSDFPCARLQDPVLTLALLFRNRFPGNAYYGNGLVREWALAGIRFLFSCQNRDGSFNEWYPNEHSFCATAFSVYSASEAMLALGIRKWGSQLEKAGEWLIKHGEGISNQVAGAVAGLYNIYRITGRKRFRKAAEEKLRILEGMQSPDGFFPEYGGADTGYLTVTLDFLGKYYRASGDRRALEMSGKALDFLMPLVHPDGSLGGSYNSRGTEFKLPHGLEILSGLDGRASYIAGLIAGNIGRTLNPLMMDDRYAFLYHVSYLQAYLEGVKPRKPARPFRGSRVFEDSGILVRSTGELYLVVNMKRGGVFRAFLRGRPLYEDSGLFGRLGKEQVTSQWNGSSGFMLEGDQITVSGNLVKARALRRLSPAKNVVLRSLSTAARSDRVAMSMKSVLRKGMVTGARKTGLGYVREIRVGRDSLTIKDSVRNPGRRALALRTSSGFVPNYSPTSRFFQSGELLAAKPRVLDGGREQGLKRVIRF